MCENRQLIRNPHDGRYYYVKCQRCDACLQEKADAHRSRIKRELSYELSANNVVGSFFVTLHYQNDHLPFVKHSELIAFFEKCVRYKCSKNCAKLEYPMLMVYRNTFDPFPIDAYTMQDFEHLKRKETFDFSNYLNLIKYLPYARRKVGRDKFVCINDVLSIVYQKDIQNFFKLLKIKLFRAGYHGFFSYTYATEYGETYLRAHIHSLINYDKRYEPLVKRCIIESWKHSDLSRRFRDEKGRYRESVELAKNPASYVSEYINLRSIVPQVYRDSKCFAPKIKFSQGFGLHFKYFSAEEVLKMFNNHSLQYPCRQVHDGVAAIRMVQVPKYVLSKYFPKFKGYRYLSSDEIFDVLLHPDKVIDYAKKMKLLVEDIDKVEISILTKRKEWCDYFDVSQFKGKERVIRIAQLFSEFAFVGSRIWALYASECIKHSYDDIKCEMDLFEHFDNISDFFEGFVTHEILNRVYDSRLTYSRDPNDFKLNRSEHHRLSEKFKRSVKRHRSHGMYENKFI